MRTQKLPVAEDARTVWHEYHDIDSSIGAFRYEDLEDLEGVDGFEAIGRAALAAGVGRSGSVGMSTSHLFEALDLVRFAVAWMEDRFGQRR